MKTIVDKYTKIFKPSGKILE